MPSVRGRVTIAIVGVFYGAARRVLLAARRLRELPDLGIRNAAGGRWPRTLRRFAAAGRRTSVVVNPEGKIRSKRIIVNVGGGGDGRAVAFVDRHAGAISAGLKALTAQFFRPRFQVRVIVQRKAATFFNIEK